ncbi:unnamed protein product [Spirodela intermedia]|uniref:Uncharacterized protein n=1 Tax=Spirodela intermedia TaxID=51605 RepID=A0A7I8JC69_SPIIN|nr:unnamed protein product [Spirodela intermedia]CAA6667734.1 unnamed protein product [Spirodela intermedia]
MKMKTEILLIAILLFSDLFAGIVTSQDHDDDDGDQGSSSSSPATSCSSNLGAEAANLIPFNTSSLGCYTAWRSRDFILLYKQEQPGLWSFVLSAPDNNAYIAVGFSTNGRMVGASAVAGWVASGGAGVVKQYALRGTSSTDCPPDQGSLQLVPAKSTILSLSSRIYLAFQLNTTQPQTRLIYAVGPRGSLPGSDFYLAEHESMVSTAVDYTTGRSSGESESSSSSLRRAHGVLTLIGWGVLLPIGMAVARYCKHWDPAWFYAHIFLQGGGFVLGLAGVITGFRLEDKVSDDVDTHKAIGIFILVSGSLQVVALLVRPKKTAKVRKYWNWYHHYLGRIAVAFAAGNIFYGLSLADEKSSWTIGYAVFLGLWFLLSLILEIRTRKKTK